MSPGQRQARARIAGLTCHSRGKTNTAAAFAAAERRFVAEVLAEAEAAGEQLTEANVQRRAQAKRKLFFARLSYASAKARTARARARRAGSAA